MKKVLALLAAVWMLCMSAALAQSAERAACTLRRTDLLSAPNETAEVLMRYYTGTRVEVVREVDERYVQVNVGMKGGSLMGYMDKRDLAFGEAAIRAVRAEFVTYLPREDGATMTLYSYPDELAPVIDDAYLVGLKHVLGSKDDRWLHIDDVYEGITSFVRLDEIELVGPRYAYAFYIRVEPTQEELSREAAIEMAKESILNDENPGRFCSTDDVAVIKTLLDICEPEVDVLYYYDTPDVLTYAVDFRNPENGNIEAGCSFWVSGKEVQTVHAGNG